MIEKLEQTNQRENLSILEKKEMKEFILRRNVVESDFPLIEKLGSFPKNTLIGGLHNLFNLSKDKSERELASIIENTEAGDEKEMYETALEFCGKYGWMASWDLMRILEKI